jgi:hypothetical protein
MKTAHRWSPFFAFLLVACHGGSPSKTETASAPSPAGCVFDWKKLEASWDRYLGAPSVETGEALTAELKAASPTKENPDCAERMHVHRRFTEETEKKKNVFTAPGHRGSEVLDALLMHSDAGYTQELYLLLGESAATDPKGFLELIAKKYAGKACPYVTTDPEEFNDVDPKKVVVALTKHAFERRRAAIAGVKHAPFSAVREECLQELRNATAQLRR